MTRTLILGGARSGKSAFAEHLAVESGREVIYLATARVHDAEMAKRIEHHRARRPASWHTIEEPLALGDALRRHCHPERIVVVDCLTLWLSNVMFPEAVDESDDGPVVLPQLFLHERAGFLDALARAEGELVLVSNEVGMGIVPMGAMVRAFADEAGRLNQATAALCERVTFMAAGLPLALKGAPC